MSTSVALVTGASAGFGRLIAEKLAQAGYVVYGTSRRAVPNADSGVQMRQLELTDPLSIQQCVDRIVTETGRIDVLVNNAGRFHEGLLEETPIEEVELLFQTNFLGVIHMNNAVLPVMRQQQQGKIIHIGSLAGLVGVTGMGYTSAVKHALEGYVETLYTEVKPFGINVSLVEPSYYRTETYDQRITSERQLIADYDALRERVQQNLLNDHENSGNPAEVAELVAQIALSSSPRLRYLIGPSAKLISRLKRYMPESFFLRGLLSRVNTA